MSELPVRRRDRWKNKFGIGRSASPNNPNIPNAGASNTPPVLAPALPSSSPNPTTTAAPPASSPPGTTDSTAITIPSHVVPAPPTTSTPSAGERDLWLKALQKLSDEDQETIRMIQPTEITQPPFPENMDALVNIIRTKQIECEEKSYKLHIQGKEIILRDVAEKTIFWLNKFKDIGDIAANFDPVHAALPWAGVRFLLQVAVGGHEQMGSLLVSVEKVIYLTHRCTIYESLYKSGTTGEEALRNLHAALVELYAAILGLMALAHRLFAKNNAARALHSLINPSKITDAIAKCQDLEIRVEIEAQNCERKHGREKDEMTRKLLEALRTPTLRTDERVSSLLESVGDEERLKILDWISQVLYGKNHATVADDRTQDTCDWLLTHNRFLEWRDTSSSMILWLCGTAGTGKTNLTSKVIDEIQITLKSNTNHEGLAFFYCNRNEADRREPLAVLRAFLRQLSTIANNQHCMQKKLRKYYTQSRQIASELGIEDCKKLLLEFINFYPKTTLILDALDECEKQQRGKLIETFDYFLAHASKPVKIFISSRPDGDIRERFKDLANIEIRAADNDRDISRFVESEITKHRRWMRMPSELQSEIIETLQTRSQGMFQWANLQIKQLLALNQAEHIRDRLGKLPEGLKDAYDEIYNGIPDNEKKIADRAFQWVMCARAPISTKLLLPAVCQDERDDTIKPVDDLDEDLLLEYCHNLLVIDPNRKVWVPSHLSVIEYFENHIWTSKKASHLRPNRLVATVCLLILNDPGSYDGEDERDGSFEQERERDSVENELVRGKTKHHAWDEPANFWLRHYARLQWVMHVQACEEDTNNRLSDLLKRFLGSPTDSSLAYRNWHKMLGKDVEIMRAPRTSPFTNSYFPSYLDRFHVEELTPSSFAAYAICGFGLYTILSEWWEDPWTDCVPNTGQGSSLLQLAAQAGSCSICRRLIDWGAEVNFQSQHVLYGSALVAALLCRNNEEVVKLLIDSGADVNMQLHVGGYGSALTSAAQSIDEQMVSLLIDSGADVNANLSYGSFGSALVAAAFRKRKEAVQLLISHGADVNMLCQVGYCGTALTAAACAGRRQTVQLLISYGADVNMLCQVGYYGTALIAAAWAGRRQTVQLLISHGADVNALCQVGDYGSALAATAQGGDKETVKLLISHGADVHARLQTGKYRNALAAARDGFSPRHVVDLLVEYGAKEEDCEEVNSEEEDSVIECGDSID